MALSVKEKQHWLEVIRQTGGNREVMLKQREFPAEYLACREQCVQEEMLLDFPGLDTVRVIVTTPQNKAEKAPLHVNFHGGGFILRQNRDDDLYCARLAVGAGAVVVDVDYASSEDAPYPMALEQCYAVTKWAYAHCAQWGCDEKRLSVGGSSAGGNLALVVAMMAKESGEAPICLQILEYAANDNAMPLGDPALLRSEAFSMLYANGDVELLKTSHVSPAFATDAELRGLPRTLFIAPKNCPFYPGNIELGMRMAEQEVEVTFRTFPNSRHGFIVRILDEWQAAQEVVVRAIRQASL